MRFALKYTYKMFPRTHAVAAAAAAAAIVWVSRACSMPPGQSRTCAALELLRPGRCGVRTSFSQTLIWKARFESLDSCPCICGWLSGSARFSVAEISRATSLWQPARRRHHHHGARAQTSLSFRRNGPRNAGAHCKVWDSCHCLRYQPLRNSCANATFSSLSIHRLSRRLSLACLRPPYHQSKGIDGYVPVPNSPRMDAVDAFHAEAVVPIYASLAICIFDIDSLGARFAAKTLDAGQMF
jgi:hypothetical protein